MRIEQLLRVFRIPFQDVVIEYGRLADAEIVSPDVRPAWYAAHRVVEMTDGEMGLYFE